MDGKVSKVTGAAGTVYGPGKVLTFTAKNSVEVRTGKSSATYFTLNGEDLGRLSKQSNPETWLFAPPDPPVKTSGASHGGPARRPRRSPAGAVRGARPDGRDGRVLHGRARRPPAHRGARARRRTCAAASSPTRTRSSGRSSACPPTSSRRTAPCPPRSRWRWPRGCASRLGTDLGRRCHGGRRARTAAPRRSRSASPTSPSPGADRRWSGGSCGPAIAARTSARARRRPSRCSSRRRRGEERA